MYLTVFNIIKKKREGQRKMEEEKGKVKEDSSKWTELEGRH